MAWCKRRRSGLASLSDGLRECPGLLSPMKTGTFRSNEFFSGALMPPQWVGDPITSKSALRILSARSCPSSCGSEHSPVSRHRMQAVQGAIRQSPIWTSSASGPRVSEASSHHRADRPVSARATVDYQRSHPIAFLFRRPNAARIRRILRSRMPRSRTAIFCDDRTI